MWALFSRLFSRKPRRYRFLLAEDAPDRLNPGTVYIVGEDGHDWSAILACPGGCGKALEMNLLPEAKPVWRVTGHEDGFVTMRPSVRLKTGCKRHFVLQHGHVRWV
jgi:hypothetical protein